MVWKAVVDFFVAVGKAVTAYATANPVKFALEVYTLYTGVKGFLQAKQMLAKGQDILANKTSAGGKIPVIYGTRRVGAQIVYMDTAQNRSKDLFVVYAIAVGECDEIIPNSIEIDGNSIYDGNIYKGGGYVGSDRYGQTGYSNHRPLNTASQVGDNQYSSAGNLGTNPALRYSFVFNLHHGASSQTVDPMLSASIGSQWTTAHKLNGICYIAASFDYDKKGMYKGVPQITVQVRGKRVFDPRDSSTKWSSNPALCFLDYIQNDEYGKGLATSQINMTAIGTAADKCDTLVDQPYYNGNYQGFTWSGDTGNDYILINDNDDWWQNKIDEVVDIKDSNGDLVIDGKDIKDSSRYEFYDQTQENRLYIDDTLQEDYTNEAGTIRGRTKRFHCNGYIDTNKNVMDNAKELLANMRGIFTYIDGKYELQIEDTGTSTFSITDDHVIADAGISVDYGNKDKRANKVVIEFFNANKKYELDTATVLHDASPEYYSDDGEILEVKAEFPYVTDPYIAYNMGKAILTRSRNQTTMQFLGTPEMYKLNVGDIVDLTYLPLNFNGKVCRVEALELQANGLVAVSLIEYFDVYTWEVPAQEPTTIIAKPPTIGAIHPPEANSIVFTDTDASPINRPTLTWTEPTDFPVRQYRVDVVDSSDNNVFSKIVDTPSVDLAFLPKGSNYEASITSFNGVGIESNASTKTFTIADDPVKTTEVEIGSETLSNIIDYGTIAGGGTSNFFQINTRLDLEDRFIWNSNGTNDWSLGTGGDDDVNLYIEGSADKLITFKDQSSELGSVKLTFGDDVSGSYFADFITLEADWTNGYVTTGSGLSKFYIKGKGYDGATASGTIATFQLTSANGYGTPLTELHGKTKTPILNLDQGSAPSTTTDLLYNVGGTLYWNGSSVNTGAGDITSVTINTSGGSLTGGASFASGDATFTLDIGTTVRGSKSFEDDVTFESNVVIQGNLDVQGTTTTIDTTNLDVKDKNITLNYGTGDTSANANGAGITIQDAVSSTQDATLTWNTANDSFNFSHDLNVIGDISSSADVSAQSFTASSSGYGTIELGGVSGAYIDLKRPNTDDFDLRLITTGTGGQINAPTGATIALQINSSNILSVSSTGIDVTGNMVVSGTVDGRDIATDGTKLDGIEAGATTDQTQAEINALGITAIGLSGTPNITVGTISSGKIGVNANTASYWGQANSLVLDASGNTGLTIKSSTSGNGRLVFTDTASSTAGLNDGGQIHYQHSDDSLNLRTAGTTALTIDSSQNATFAGTISSGDIYIGTADTTNGVLTIHGGGTGNAEGGEIRLGLSADHDGTYDFYRIDTINDDFRIGRSGTTDITLDSSGNVGINQSSPSHLLSLYKFQDDTPIKLQGSAGSYYITNNYSSDALTFIHNSSERMRIDSSGNLLVGKTGTTFNTNGVALRSNGSVWATVTGTGAASFNIKGTDGIITDFWKDGTTVGSIGTTGGDLLIGTGNTGLLFYDASPQIIPRNTTGANVDATVDLGSSGSRFKDLYLSGTATMDGLTVAQSNEATSPSTSLGDYSIGLLSAGTSGYFGQNIGFYAGGTTSVRASINSTDDGASGATGISFSTGNATSTDTRLKLASNGDISFYDDTGTTAKFFWDASAERLGLGTTAPAANLHVDASSPEFRLSQSGTAKVRLRTTGNNYINTGHNLGIGTSSPQGNLHVEGAAGASGGGIIYVTDADNGSTASDALQISKSGDTAFIYNRETSGNLQLGAGGNANHMIVRTDGKVGIGTTSPTSPLTIKSSSTSGSTSGLLLQGNSNTNTIVAIGEKSTDGGRFHMYDGGVEKIAFYTDGTANHISAGNVGIGTSSPRAKLESYVSGNFSTTYNDFSGDGLYIQTNGTVADGEYTAGISFSRTAANNARVAGIAGVQEGSDADKTGLAFFTHPSTATASALQESLRISADGSVGIGRTPTSHILETAGEIKLTSLGANEGIDAFNTNSIQWGIKATSATTAGIAFEVANTERMRIDSSGNVLVGTTSESTWESAKGFRTRQSGSTTITRDGNPPLYVNRLTSDGDITVFKKGTTTVGSIGTQSARLTIGTGDTGLRFVADANQITPWNLTTNGVSNGLLDLGNTNNKFKDLYLSGTVTANGLTIDGTSILDSETNFVANSTASNKSLVLASTGATGGSGQYGASLAFSRINTDSPRAAIAAVNTDSNFERMGLSFWTHPTNTVGNMVKRMQIDHDGDISFYEDTGTTQALFWDASAEQLLLGITATAAGGSLVAKTDSNGYGIAIEENSGSERWSLGVDVDGDLNFLNSADTTPTVTFNDAGNVGIGTSSPDKALTISASDSQVRLYDADGTNQFASFQSDNGIAKITSRNNTSHGQIAFQRYNGTVVNESMRIDSSGNVGIGTTSPSAKLDVEGTAQVNLLDVTHTGDRAVNFTRTGANSFSIEHDLNQFYFWNQTTSESPLLFQNDGDVIMNAGNVGIGTTSPNRNLHIIGQYTVENSTSPSGALLFIPSSDANRIYSRVSNASSSSRDLAFLVGSTEAMRIDSSQRVGIGTTSPASELHISSSAPILTATSTNATSGFRLNVVGGSSSLLRIQDNGSERIRIMPSGDTGIGTSSPSEKLHVLGNTKVTGTITVGASHTIGDDGQTDDFLIRSSEGNNLILQAGVDSDSLIFKTANTALTINPEGKSTFAEDATFSGNVGIGTNTFTNSYKTYIEGLDQDTANLTDSGNHGATLYLRATANAAGSGGAVAFGTTFGNKTPFAAIKGHVVDGATNTTGDLCFSTRANTSATALTERLRIKLNGRVGIGTTAPETPLHVSTAKSSVTDSVLTLHDTTETFGRMIEFVGQGSTDSRGIIGFQEPQANAPELFIANGGGDASGVGVGLAFWSYISTARISPCDNLGDYKDNAIDLGWSSARFDDIYATNGTIQTSDRNEKQDIQALTEAEQRVATACKGLIRRFRWQDSVAEKDDNPDSDEAARYHFGVIAQDLQDAFTAEGLDAGDYGMFISSTWTDDDGNEQTRLGVRYSELLAFIISTL